MPHLFIASRSVARLREASLTASIEVLYKGSRGVARIP